MAYLAEWRVSQTYTYSPPVTKSLNNYLFSPGSSSILGLMTEVGSHGYYL